MTADRIPTDGPLYGAWYYHEAGDQPPDHRCSGREIYRSSDGYVVTIKCDRCGGVMRFGGVSMTGRMSDNPAS